MVDLGTGTRDGAAGKGADKSTKCSDVACCTHTSIRVACPYSGAFAPGPTEADPDARARAEQGRERRA